jgi:predicted amidophosphoribosyltransferase
MEWNEMDMAAGLKKKCVCPNCGADMQLSATSESPVYVCPDCGCTIDGEHQDYGQENVCPNCNQPLEGNECPYCGYDLGSDFD